MSGSDIIRRILGVIILLVGLSILGLGLFGAFTVGDAVGDIATSVENALVFADDSLTAARETIVFSQDTLVDVSAAVDTAVATTLNVSKAVSDSQPFIANVNSILTEELPTNLETLQATLPAVTDVAGVIDQTLTTLSNIGIDRTIDLPFNQSIPLQFDLGIDYNPEVPFDDSIRELSTSLEGLPASLRELDEDLTVTNDNLGVLSDDLVQASEDLDVINARISELSTLFNDYLVLIDQLSDSVADARTAIPAQLQMLQTGVIIGLVLLGLSQLASIYVGYELLAGHRDPADPVAPAVSNLAIDTPSPGGTTDPVALPSDAAFDNNDKEQPSDRPA